MRGNSPKKSTDQVLGMLTVNEIQSFLMDTLNLPPTVTYLDHRPHFGRWLKRWQRLFTYRSEDGDVTMQSKLIAREQLETFVPKFWQALRRVWYEKNPRQRDWYFYRIRAEYQRMLVFAENPDLIDISEPDAPKRLLKLERLSRARGDVDESQRRRFFETFAIGVDFLDEAPRICPFEAAVYWLQVNQKLMVYCEGPVCPAPYFFRTEKGQKYCSPECADPARKQAKLKWWNENRKNQGTKKSLR
jgi:hypothetical protein